MNIAFNFVLAVVAGFGAYFGALSFEIEGAGFGGFMYAAGVFLGMTGANS